MRHGTGCNFCRRVGLPIVPVRLSVKEKGDPLPGLPANLSIPIAAEGDAAYTLRLMREGFLYIWAERAARWIDYYVTGDGYFYLLPENGSVPPNLANGDIAPCITQPVELATASLITLPVKPAGMTNGVYWFAWSSEKWTPAVRLKQEDAAWRSQSMQAFDMDAWLITHRAPQALTLNHLADSVAEYSPDLRHSKLSAWTPSPLKAVSSHSAADLQQAADALQPGNGAILVLSDPVGVATEISALARYGMQQAVDNDKALKRGIALQTMIDSIELAMRNYFYLSAKAGDARYERQMRYGWESPAGPHFPAPDVAERMRGLNEASRGDRVDEAWNTHYEKYIDRAKEKAFLDKLQTWLTEYNQNSIVPVTRMYLNWLQSQEMSGYFIHHFDSECARSGARYIQTVCDVLIGMTDKGGVIDYIDKQLNGQAISRENFLQRAAFFNNDAWIAQVDKQMQPGGKDWWLGMSWDRLADGAKEYSGKYAVAIVLALEKLSLLWSEAMMKSIDLMVKGIPVKFAIGMLAMQGKAFSAVSVMPGTKNYVRAMTQGMAGMLEMSARSGGRLYSSMRDMANRLVKDLPDAGEKQILLPRIIDVDEAMKLKQLPEKERMAKLGRALLTEDELVRHLFPAAPGASSPHIYGLSAGGDAAERMTASGLKFGGTVFSAYFQWVVLHYGYKQSGIPSTLKESAVFGANISMALSASAEVLKTIIAPLTRLELPAVPSLMRDWALKIVGISLWETGGYLGGIVYAIAEGLEGRKYLMKGKRDIGLAHMINALGVGMMTVGGGSTITVRILLFFGVSDIFIQGSVLTAFFLGPMGIFVGMLLVLGAGAWLLSHSRNEVQKWLLSMYWREIPKGEVDLPEEYPDAEIEQESYKQLINKWSKHV